MYLGLEKPGITGGVGSSLALPPLLLGGVLKGDTSAASAEVLPGASDARGAGSVECGLAGIFGLPARFTGGGTGGAEEVGRSLFRGSGAAGAEPVCEGNSGLDPNAGVVSRLGILKDLAPFVADVGGVGESRAACDFGREGCGECI
jgi:hypothetical protein